MIKLPWLNWSDVNAELQQQASEGKAAEQKRQQETRARDPDADDDREAEAEPAKEQQNVLGPKYEYHKAMRFHGCVLLCSARH